MKRRPLPLPTVPEAFPAAFRTLLHDLLARGGRVRGRRVDPQRARRAALSQSGTFVGHRPYVRGDDPRRIDWAACARTGDLFVKLFEEEQRRTVTLVLDLSASLLVGTPPRALAARRLAAVVGGLALRHLDGVAVVAPGAGASSLVNFAGAGDVEALLHHLDGLPVADAAPAAALQLVLQRGMSSQLHWISDFAAPERFELPLAALRRRGASITGWLPSLPEDQEVPRLGYVRLRDPETGAEFGAVVDAALTAAMRRELELLRRRQDRLFAQSGCLLVRWPAPAEHEFQRGPWQEILTWCSR
ncbi:MAG: DUF58 domain-containing protein [Planctomycetes bacterium]|nr:DUF58 domain-containing protein [Planctomycetota bacterium]